MLVIAPTRELVEQIYVEARKLCYKTGLIVNKAYGGTSSSLQATELRNGCDILIATPGRLKDFIEREIITVSHCTNLVLDEADRMLDMGFEPQLNFIINDAKMPKTNERCNLFFSATFPNDVKNLASKFLNDYYYVSVSNNDETIVNENIKHTVVKTEHNYNEILIELAKTLKGSILIFSDTKRGADQISYVLSNSGFQCGILHGDISQENRQVLNFNNREQLIIF